MKNIEQLLDRYRLDKMALGGSEETMDHVQRAVRLLGEFVDDIGVEQVDATKAKEFAVWLRTRDVWIGTDHAKARKLAATSINSYFRAIKGFWAWLEEAKLIQENPLAGLRSPKFPKTMAKVFTEEQMKAVFNQMVEGTRTHALIFVFLDSGARLSEIACLDRDVVDLIRRRARVIGKDRTERFVYFSPITARSVELYVNKERPQPVAENRLFLNEDGRPMTPSRIQTIIALVGKKANLPERLSPHKLRHTYATLSLKYGGNLEYLRKTLGHTDIKTTSDFYLNVEDKDVASSYETSSPIANIQREPDEKTKNEVAKSEPQKLEMSPLFSDGPARTTDDLSQILGALNRIEIKAGLGSIKASDALLETWGGLVSGMRPDEFPMPFYHLGLDPKSVKLVHQAGLKVLEYLSLFGIVNSKPRKISRDGRELPYVFLTDLGRHVVMELQRIQGSI